MSGALHKNSIVKKTIEVGSSTLLSRLLGIVREGLTVMYLGAGAGSDIFMVAFRIPNSLRKVFAEGALSSSFVPTLIHVARSKGRQEANSLMSLAFVVFEGLVVSLCILAMWKAEATISFLAPGWTADKVAATVPLLRILMPFIFFISSSALLAGALQSVGHFFVPAFSPVLLNIVFITGLLTCWTYNLPVTHLCCFIMFGGFLQFVGHLITYFRLNFAFGPIDTVALRNFGSVIGKFLLGSLSMSIMEINLTVSTQFASYLSDGSISLIYYANRFMGIPLGVFAVAFSTILLPHFSRISSYAPKRLSFYLLETAKFVFWITIPVTIFMSFLSEKVFYTLFLSDKFTAAQAGQAGTILMVFVLGLFFFSLNKILLSMYYALHVMWIPALVSVVCALINIGLNVALSHYLQAWTLALSMTIAGTAQTVLLVILLKKYFNFRLYWQRFGEFAWRYTLQLVLIFTAFFALYWGMESLILALAPVSIKQFLLYKLGYWFWVAPLCGITCLALFVTRKVFKVTLYFLD
jgi:putative peptidoglycan lipid II flippase